MQLTYLETSAVNWLFGRADANRVRSIMAERGTNPVIGLDVIYECAKNYLKAEGSQRGTDLFRFIRDLEPVYGLPIPKLIEQDLLRFHQNSTVVSASEQSYLHALSNEVDALATGQFDDKARTFISSRDAAYKSNMVQMGTSLLKAKDIFLESNPNAFVGIKTWDDFLVLWRPQFPDTIRKFLGDRVTRDESERLARDLDRYPAIKALVLANTYILYIHLIHGQIPALDRIPDFRHMISAASYGSLVMNDQDALKKSSLIIPGVRVAPVESSFDTL